jgi:molecular chaperone GrpE
MKTKKNDNVVQTDQINDTNVHIDPETEKLKKEAEEWKGKYLRALADYQNLEKRKQEEFKEIRIYAAERLVIKLLPVLDNFYQAQMQLQDKGLELALKECMNIFSELDIKQIDTEGKTYDPMTMECIEMVTGSENKVIAETSPGYIMGDKVIRVAKVKVGIGDNKVEKQSDSHV